MISVRYASKYYPEQVALEEISFTAGPGEIIGVFGANGAGKSTFLKAVAGLIRLTHGTIEIDGVDARQSRLISYVSDAGTFFPAMTVLEHRDFFQNLLPGFQLGRFDRLVDYFQLPLRQRTGNLSAGQQARFEWCCGLCKNRPYLIMDEPFLGKDLITRQHFLQLLAGLLQSEETLILATHFVQEVEPLLSRALILKAGRLVADQDLEAWRQNSRNLSDLIREYIQDDQRKLQAMLQSEWDEG